jgi:hypothetical protein
LDLEQQAFGLIGNAVNQPTLAKQLSGLVMDWRSAVVYKDKAAALNVAKKVQTLYQTDFAKQGPFSVEAFGKETSIVNGFIRAERFIIKTLEFLIKEQLPNNPRSLQPTMNNFRQTLLKVTAKEDYTSQLEKAFQFFVDLNQRIEAIKNPSPAGLFNTDLFNTSVVPPLLQSPRQQQQPFTLTLNKGSKFNISSFGTTSGKPTSNTVSWFEIPPLKGTDSL